MEMTRVDSKALAADVTKALDLMSQVEALIVKWLVVLSDEERAALARPPIRFLTEVGHLLAAARVRPGLCAAAEFDPAAVEEDLANAAVILELTDRVHEL